LDGNKKKVITAGTAFDRKSIMLYDSWTFSEIQQGGIGDAPMVMWKTGGKTSRPPWGTVPTEANAMLIGDNMDVSKGDAYFVKKYYPW
jgi:hypothetical protein